MGLVEDLWHGCLKRGLKEYVEEGKRLRIEKLQESYRTLLHVQGFIGDEVRNSTMWVYYEWKEQDIDWEIFVTLGVFDIQIEVLRDNCIEEERKFDYNKPNDVFAFIKLYTTQEPKEENK